MMFVLRRAAASWEGGDLQSMHCVHVCRGARALHLCQCRACQGSF